MSELSNIQIEEGLKKILFEDKNPGRQINVAKDGNIKIHIDNDIVPNNKQSHRKDNQNIKDRKKEMKKENEHQSQTTPVKSMQKPQRVTKVANDQKKGKGSDRENWREPQKAPHMLHEDPPPSVKDLEILAKDYLYPLKKKSTRFPRAKFFCRLCEYHCDSVQVSKIHAAESSRHSQLKQARENDIILRNLPQPSAPHISALDELIENIYSKHALTDEDVKYRLQVVDSLQAIVLETMPDVKLTLYGSSVSGFGMKSSDLNIDASVPSESNASDILTSLYHIILDREEYSKVTNDFTSKLPSIMFTLPAGEVCRVSVGNILSCEVASLLKTYCLIDSRVSRLGLAFRLFAKICQMDKQSEGTLPAYSFNLMTLYFLQHTEPPVLPILQELFPPNIERKLKMIDGKNCWYFSDLENLDKVWKGTNTKTIGQLWIDLLRYYSIELDFAVSVICIRRNEPLVRGEKKWSGKKMAVEDPFSTKRNLTRSVSHAQLFEYIYHQFKEAYKYFSMPQLKDTVKTADKNIQGEVDTQKEDTVSTKTVSTLDSPLTTFIAQIIDSAIREATGALKTLSIDNTLQSDVLGNIDIPQSADNVESCRNMSPEIVDGPSCKDTALVDALVDTETDKDQNALDDLDDQNRPIVDEIEVCDQSETIDESTDDINVKENSLSINDLDGPLSPTECVEDSFVGASETVTELTDSDNKEDTFDSDGPLAAAIGETLGDDGTGVCKLKTNSEKSNNKESSCTVLDAGLSDSDGPIANAIKESIVDDAGTTDSNDDKDNMTTVDESNKFQFRFNVDDVLNAKDGRDNDETVQTGEDAEITQNDTKDDFKCSFTTEADKLVARKVIEKLPATDKLSSQDFNYEFDSSNFLGGKGPSKFCSICSQEGHLLSDCPDVILPEIHPLPAMTPSFRNLLNDILIVVPVDFAPTEAEVWKRQDTLKEIENYIRKCYNPDVRLCLFGSSCNGFGFKCSDLDICMTLDKHDTAQDLDCERIIEELAVKLKKMNALFNVVAITTAKVPIIKFKHRRMQLEGDISLYNTLAQRNTVLLQAYADIDPRVKTLGYIMKVFAKICDIGDASRGSLSSYAYTLLVIYFLQQRKPPIIPVLQELYDKSKPKPEVIVEGRNTWFFTDLENLNNVWSDYGTNTESVADLWLGLLCFYTEEFQITDHVVCIRQLEKLTRFQKLWNGNCLAIEDPFDLSHNLGAGVSRKMHKYIMQTLIYGRKVFGTPVDDIPNGYNTPQDYFFDSNLLTEGHPPNDRGCRVCGKIGHIAKECPVIANKKARNEREKERREQDEKRRQDERDRPPHQGTRNQYNREYGSPQRPLGKGVTHSPGRPQVVYQRPPGRQHGPPDQYQSNPNQNVGYRNQGYSPQSHKGHIGRGGQSNYHQSPGGYRSPGGQSGSQTRMKTAYFYRAPNAKNQQSGNSQYGPSQMGPAYGSSPQQIQRYGNSPQQTGMHFSSPCQSPRQMGQQLGLLGDSPYRQYYGSPSKEASLSQGNSPQQTGQYLSTSPQQAGHHYGGSNQYRNSPQQQYGGAMDYSERQDRPQRANQNHAGNQDKGSAVHHMRKGQGH